MLFLKKKKKREIFNFCCMKIIMWLWTKESLKLVRLFTVFAENDAFLTTC